ncbi:zinc-binding alcohol dehydrogenase family protein [Membranihabitans marinus]|uniref:zinc-binding alcohol dehydrogenase family protein n=1 Tax=Membranihabitans marinus TaxID=1227546 RepID=UPI001F1698E3|nr:zinc-binding alcohol dehydrogenase family protein [Membranihabitans marinus]
MQYIVCDQPGSFSIREKEKPVRQPGQALLKVLKVGICGTDIHAYGGNQAYFTYPRILGHELAAEVVEIEDHSNIDVGDRVAIMPYVSCGKCGACRSGKTNCCSSISVLGVHVDGGMQEYMVIDTSLLLPANHLSLDEIMIIEPLAIGAHAMRRANIQVGETIVVVGAGPIGMGIAKLSQLAGARVILMDMNHDRLNYAEQELGITYVVNVRHQPLESIKKWTNGELADAVFDATGHKGALEQGIQYMGHGGRYILVGLSKGDLTFNHPQIHAKESTILCSRNANRIDFEYVMKALPAFPSQSYITHSCDYEEINKHFESWIKPDAGVMKAYLNFDK